MITTMIMTTIAIATAQPPQPLVVLRLIIMTTPMAPRPARLPWCFAWQAAITAAGSEGVRPQPRRRRGAAAVIAKGESLRGLGHHTASDEPLLPPYVPAPVPEIIANVEDATIPIERDSDLTDAEKAAKHQRGQALRRATMAQFYGRRRWSGPRSMLADGRRDFKLTFGIEQGQTFAMGDIPHAAAAQEEEDFAPVRLSEQEDNFAVNIRVVDLALLAVQQDAPDLDRTVWDMVTSNVKTALNAERGQRAESLADHFAMEDRLEAKSNAHAGELVERAKAHLEHVATDPKRPAKAAAILRADQEEEDGAVGGAGRVDAGRLRGAAGGRGAPRAEVPDPAMPRRGAPDQGDQEGPGCEGHAGEAAGANPAHPMADVGGALQEGAAHRAAAAAAAAGGEGGAANN